MLLVFTLITAVLYVEVGRLHWRTMLTTAVTPDEKMLASADAAGAAWVVRAAFIALWPAFLTYGWVAARLEARTLDTNPVAKSGTLDSDAEA